MADTNSDIKKMPFERAIEELESIVKRLEEGKVPLEESVAIYERGEALKGALRGVAAPGRSAGGEDHPRRRRQADRQRAARRGLRPGPGRRNRQGGTPRGGNRLAAPLPP